jgi:hypothetical protein
LWHEGSTKNIRNPHEILVGTVKGRDLGDLGTEGKYKKD